MLGLPKSTEISKQLPKKAIFDRFKPSPADRKLFDEQINRMAIIAEISPQTVAIKAGAEVAAAQQEAELRIAKERQIAKRELDKALQSTELEVEKAKQDTELETERLRREAAASKESEKQLRKQLSDLLDELSKARKASDDAALSARRELLEKEKGIRDILIGHTLICFQIKQRDTYTKGIQNTN